ncbi:MAG: ATP-binding protein [Myxococcota bacterium]|nr:ATP-binding protein [Myxococcota bacterium]
MTGHRQCRHAQHRGRWHAKKSRWRRSGRLQRRLFMWFGATIVFTAIVVGLMFRLLSPTERFQRDAEGFQRFVSARFEQVWRHPPARDALVRDLNRDLRLDATLYDAGGHVLVRHGARCDEAWGRIPLVRRDGHRLGTLEVCGEPYRWGGWRFPVALLVGVLILWAAAGILARRLTRPLRRLEGLARRIGEGDLSARSELDPQRHGELGTLGVTMDEMAERIEKQLADQRELLAAVSHELRTPLGHLRVLLEMARGKPSEKMIDDIEEEVLEVDALVGQLLASSRVDFGSLQVKSVDAVELASRALERAELPPDDLAVEGDPALMEADPTLLARALANLLQNAKQHGGGVEALTIRFRPTDVVFEVSDRGPGFSEAERERVFEAFYRGEHRAGASLGLGLSLVRRIAEAHGGRAWVEDNAPGARVCFSLDAAPASDPRV